jgi:hypothetical protein
MRYAKGIRIVIPSEVEESRGAIQCNFAAPSTPLRSAQDDGTLFNPCQRFGEPRFAANGEISVNDAALGSFIDRRNGRADLISTGRCRGTNLLLDRPQPCHNAVITK